MRKVSAILLFLCILCIGAFVGIELSQKETHDLKATIYSTEETDALELPDRYLVIDESNREFFGKPVNRAVLDYSDAMETAYRYLGSFYQDPPDFMYTAYDYFPEDEWFCVTRYVKSQDCYIVQFAQLGGPVLVLDAETGEPLYFWEIYDEVPSEDEVLEE